MHYYNISLKDEFKAMDPVAWSAVRVRVVTAYRLLTSGSKGTIQAAGEVDDLRRSATRGVWTSSGELLKNSGWFNLEEEPDLNPDYPWAEYRKQGMIQTALLEKATSGDSEAAVEFCKLYKAGKINLHAAMG
jgi:hypothetical protein